MTEQANTTGSTDQGGVPTFKQSRDAKGGPTGQIFRGKIYAHGKALPKDAAKFRTSERAPEGIPSSHPYDLWPEMKTESSGNGLQPAGEDRSGGSDAESADDTGGDGYSRADLEGMSKAELAELAEAQGVEVSRGDGEAGDPLKEDYITALAGK